MKTEGDEKEIKSNAPSFERAISRKFHEIYPKEIIQDVLEVLCSRSDGPEGLMSITVLFIIVERVGETLC